MGTHENRITINGFRKSIKISFFSNDFFLLTAERNLCILHGQVCISAFAQTITVN